MAPSRSVPLFGSALTSAALLLAGSGCDGVSIITDPDMGPGGSLTKGVVTGELSIFTPGAVGPEATATEARAAPSFDAQAVMSALRARLPTKTAARGLEGVELELELPGGSAWALPRDPDASFVPGELLVTFRSQGLEAVPHLSENPDLALWRFEVGVFGGPAVATVRIRDAQRPDRAIGPDETLWLRDRLATHEAFRIVELNRYRWPLAEPNDQAFAAQWHYPKMNLPAAWDITQGSPQVVVAVIDDGVNPHPDLTRSMGGFDMISDVAIAGDGDGRDAVPSQVPLSHGTSSVWHGTHVAGTVGATTDNGQGAAGVDWNARILPVRVLGKVIPGRGAGTSVDIIAGMNWAVGIDVPQAPTNTNPADVLNLSLGGGGLVQAEQEAINAAVGRGAAVVVAAGNENRDAGLTSLAGYQNVIVVGATDHGGRRAPYSNFGPAIDIMAPGGHLGADANADGRPDGVLSTFLDESGQQTGFAFLEGTSMASPHAAGVAALMKAVRPNITPAEIEQIMKDTAVTSSRCNEGCGAGLVNAAAAVIAAQGGANPMAPPSLALGSERVNIGSQSQGVLQVFNAGGGELVWQAGITGQSADRITIQGPAGGTLGAGAAAALTLVVNRTGLSDGDYQAVVNVQAGNDVLQAVVLFRVGVLEIQDIGSVVVGAVAFNDAGDVIVGGAAESTLAGGYQFQMESDPGTFMIIAIADRNNNDELDAGDWWGINASLDNPVDVEVTVGGSVAVPAFDLLPYEDDITAVAPACGEYRACIEACGDNPLCVNQCNSAISNECESCFNNEVGTCAGNMGCQADDLSCLCVRCESSLDTCFGPLLCGGGGTQMPMPSQSGVGGACDDVSVTCQAPFQCDMSVAGGYCTRSCLQDNNCGDGVCVALDPDGDGNIDDALCFAACTGVGTCPRSNDACVDLQGGGAVCVPN